jgi:hypothetical protein
VILIADFELAFSELLIPPNSIQKRPEGYHRSVHPVLLGCP